MVFLVVSGFLVKSFLKALQRPLMRLRLKSDVAGKRSTLAVLQPLHKGDKYHLLLSHAASGGDTVRTLRQL